MLFSGIDLHKRTIAIQTVDGEGTLVRPAQLAAQRPALTAYFATLPGPTASDVSATVNLIGKSELLQPNAPRLTRRRAVFLRRLLLLWPDFSFSDQQPCRGDANLEFCGPRHRDERARAILGIEQRREECITPTEPKQIDWSIRR